MNNEKGMGIIEIYGREFELRLDRNRSKPSYKDLTFSHRLSKSWNSKINVFDY